MRKSILAVLALGMVAALAPVAGHATHCNRNMVIFAGPVNSNAVVCVADEGEDIDGRIIYPGTTSFSMRYTVDLGEEVPFIFVDLTGSLYPTPKRVKLTRSFDSTLGFWSYNSTSQPIPGGRTASGCITATADVLDDEMNSTTYRHIEATC